MAIYRPSSNFGIQHCDPGQSQRSVGLDRDRNCFLKLLIKDSISRKELKKRQMILMKNSIVVSLVVRLKHCYMFNA